MHHLTICCFCLQKRPVEDSDWRKNVEAMSGMEGRKKMFDAAKGPAQWIQQVIGWCQDITPPASGSVLFSHSLLQLLHFSLMLSFLCMLQPWRWEDCENTPKWFSQLSLRTDMFALCWYGFENDFIYVPCAIICIIPITDIAQIEQITLKTILISDLAKLNCIFDALLVDKLKAWAVVLWTVTKWFALHQLDLHENRHNNKTKKLTYLFSLYFLSVQMCAH